MAKVGIFFGLSLCVLTVAGLVATTDKTVTQFVPMMFGIPLMFLGVVGLNPHRRWPAMVCATGLAGIGAIAGLARLGFLAYDGLEHHAFNWLWIELVAAMTGVFVTFVLLIWVWSRRRSRRLGSGRPDAEAPLRTPFYDETNEKSSPKAQDSRDKAHEPVLVSAAPIPLAPANKDPSHSTIGSS
ncbi:MAG: hypothetical protein AAGD07_12865 [Planctomycetota bacterium]